MNGLAGRGKTGELFTVLEPVPEATTLGAGVLGGDLALVGRGDTQLVGELRPVVAEVVREVVLGAASAWAGKGR